MANGGGLVNALGSESAVEAVNTYLKPVGSLFIRPIMMIAAPLVLASRIVGAGGCPGGVMSHRPVQKIFSGEPQKRKLLQTPGLEPVIAR